MLTVAIISVNCVENVITQSESLNETVADAQATLSATAPHEFMVAVLILVLAWFIGRSINRWIDRRAEQSVPMSIADFVAPLLAPCLAVLFIMATMAGLKHWGKAMEIMPFALKLGIAWFAIQLVRIMSSRQSAGWLIALVVVPITLLHLFGLWGLTLEVLTAASFTVGKVEISLYLILKAILVVVALWWVASFIMRVTDSRLRRIRDMRASNRTLILKIFQIVLYCFVFIMGMQMLGIDLTALSVFGGALGVGLGFGLQKIASNFISGIILLFEKSIEVDSMIELADGTVGFIRETHARYTLLETQDGREIMIPNEEFISQRVTSWTYSNRFARADIAITIAYDSDFELAQKLMLAAADSHPKRTKLRPSMCVLNAFRDSGVELHLYFWVADVTDGRMEPKSEVMLAIMKAFKANNITIPYPQRELRVMNVNPPAEAVAAAGGA